jgi:hypothetical protein
MGRAKTAAWQCSINQKFESNKPLCRNKGEPDVIRNYKMNIKYTVFYLHSFQGNFTAAVSVVALPYPEAVSEVITSPPQGRTIRVLPVYCSARGVLNVTFITTHFARTFL